MSHSPRSIRSERTVEDVMREAQFESQLAEQAVRRRLSSIVSGDIPLMPQRRDSETPHGESSMDGSAT